MYARNKGITQTFIGKVRNRIYSWRDKTKGKRGLACKGVGWTKREEMQVDGWTGGREI